MQELWNRIEAWLSVHAPKIHAKLNSGATDEELQAAETEFGVVLPEDFKAFYRVHNGQKGNSVPLVDGDWLLLSLEHVAKQWRLQKQLLGEGVFQKAKAKAKGAVRADWWNAKWIPVGSNNSGDFHCLDLDPPAKGKPGQIVSYWHADARRERIAASFTEWISAFVVDLEAGKYQLVEFRGLQRTDNT